MNLPRLKKKYNQEIIYQLKKKMKYKSIMEVPKLKKICINQGLGSSMSNKKIIKSSIKEISLISGQKPIITKSKKAISNFKLRKNMDIGIKVTLRKNKMYEFLDRLITISLPRVRDFKGLNIKGFDKNGNYNLGIKEQIIFPEIKIDKINKLIGMNISLITNSKNKKESYELLKLLGMPFKN